MLAIGALMWTVGLWLVVLTSHDLAFPLDVPNLHAALHVDASHHRLIHLRLAYRLDRARAENQAVVDRSAARLRRVPIKPSDVRPLPDDVMVYEDGRHPGDPPKRMWWHLLHRRRDRSQRSSSRASGTVTQR